MAKSYHSIEKTRRAAAGVVILLVAGLAGCGTAPQNQPPPGVLAVWGSAGRIDGTFVQPRVIDCLADRVLVIDRSGRVQFLDGTGKYLGKFTLANIDKGYPTGMAVAGDGTIWIAETHAYRVGVYSQDGRELLAFGGEGRQDGRFIYVTDVAVSPQARVYATDFGGTDRVQVFDGQGRFVAKWGGTGSEPGLFRRPQALALGPDGSVFVADSCNDRIQKFSPDGKVLGVFGSSGSGSGQLRYPYDLATSRDGVIYIAEYGNCRIQRMSLDGEFRGTWGKPGALAGELAQPWGVAAGADGRLYILDTGNSRVVVLDLKAAVWTGVEESV